MTTPEESPGRNRNYQLWRDCTHEDTVTDPDTGEKVCLHCALTVLSEPVEIGTRLVSIDEFNRRLKSKLAELDAARAYCSRLQQRIGGIPCAWPCCEAAPMLRSKWKRDTVPFQPTPGRPVYCRECHKRRCDHAKAESAARILEATGTSDRPFRTVLYDAAWPDKEGAQA